MNKSLFFSLFLLISVGVCAQTGFENTSNLISIDSARTKKTAIKIYPNPSYGKLSVTASTASPLHFYVFDMEGTLVFQAVLQNKERSAISLRRMRKTGYAIGKNWFLSPPGRGKGWVIA